MQKTSFSSPRKNAISPLPSERHRRARERESKSEPAIEDENSEWNMVQGVPRNLPISVLTYDPNNPTTFYAGTGEHYTGGDALGNGLWRSTDAGATWENIFGGRSDSEEVFKSEVNELVITTQTDENPISFLQASFGPNLPGPPLSYLENEIIVADPVDGLSPSLIVKVD